MHLFLASVGATGRVAVPNLVQHAPLHSLIGNDWQGERPAVCVPTEPAGGIAWHTAPPPVRALPVMWWPTGEAVWLVPPARPGHRWNVARAESVLPAFGVDGAAVAALGTTTVASWSVRLGELDPKYVHALWTTAYGLGLVLADVVGSDPARLEHALARPLAREALATMPGGALRFLVEGDQLARVGADLQRLVELGVRQGHQRAPAAR